MVPAMTMPASPSYTIAPAADTNAATSTSTGMSTSMSSTMTFFASVTTPLLWSAWRPDSPASYAGTCVFLAALGGLWRVAVALKPILEATLWRRYDDVAEPGQGHAQGAGEKEDDGAWEVDAFLPSSVRPVGRVVRTRWRGATFVTRACRALYEAGLSAVGYLLMLAVMTMNVGYFLSVVAGIFVGTFALGNLAVDEGNNRWHNC